MIIQKVDVLGNVIKSITLNEGRYIIQLKGKTYIMCNDYIDEIKPDLQKIQQNFIDNI